MNEPRWSEPVDAYLTKRTSSIPRLTPPGSDLVNLAPGDPVLPVPEVVSRAVVSSVANDRHGYTPPTGIAELREAIRQKFQRVNGLEYSLDEIIVGMGSKQVIVAALLATIRDRDEVLVLTPSFSMYPDMVRLARGTPVQLRADASSGFKVTPEALRSAMTDRTRWIILNTPNNPTGAVYSAQELERLAEVLTAHPTAQLISDEIYEQLIYSEEQHFSPARISPEVRSRVLTVSGLSKTYGMTGWRIGYAGGPADLVEAMGAVQLLTTTCPPRVTQAAAVAALGIPSADIEETVSSLRRRRDMVVDALSEIPGTDVHTPAAGLYVVVDCETLISGTDMGSGIDLANWLREDHGVMVMPGELFDLPMSIRISFCIPEADVRRGLDRVSSAFGELAHSRLPDPKSQEETP